MTTGLRRALQRAATLAAAHPLATALVVGGLARLIAALVATGFHARDDYFHVVEPAARWLANPAFNWESSNLPGAGLRSHLLPRVVQGLLLTARSLGITSPAGQLRFVATVLAAYSLTLVPAMGFTAGRLLERRGQRVALALAALHPVVIYAGTRLLLGGLAMPPLLLAVGLATSKRGRDLLLAGAAAGLAFWLRYPVAAAVVGLLVAWPARGQTGRPRLAASLALFAAGFAAVLGGEALFDLATTARPLAPLINNVAMNLCSATATWWAKPCEMLAAQGIALNPALSRSGIGSYLGMWLLLSAPPATVLFLLTRGRPTAEIHVILLPWALFVLLHLLVPHKEERFMLPVLPLFLVMLAWAVARLDAELHRGGRAIIVRGWPPLRRWFIALHAVGLVLALTARSQGNQQDLQAALRVDGGMRALVSMGPELQPYMLGRPEVPLHRRGEASRAGLRWAYDDLAEIGFSPNRVVAFADDAPALAGWLVEMDLICDAPEQFEGWWFDRLLHRLNPHHNRRRAPIVLWRCERPALAAAD